MKGQRILIRLLAIELMLALATGLSQAQGADPALANAPVTLYAIADASVDSSKPNQNFGAETSMGVGHGGLTAPIQAHAYLRFDVSGIPTNAAIKSAQLQLYLSEWYGTLPYTVTVYSVNQS